MTAGQGTDLVSQLGSAAEPHPAQQFSGLLASCLVGSLRASGGDELVVQVLAAAGEPRSPELLASVDEWSDYGELRRLLEAAVEVCGERSLADAGAYVFELNVKPAQAELFQGLGSPADLLSRLGGLATQFSTIVRLDAIEVGPAEWLITQQVTGDFEPFGAYCRLQAGLLSIIPRLFGFEPAHVVEEACQCDGADSCRFRFTWEEIDELTRRVEYLEYYSQLLETRLAGLQHTVTDLVGNDDLETILERIVASARRAVVAPSYVLALESLSAATRRVYSTGLDESAAADVASRLLTGEHDSDGLLAVDVRSSSRSYGRLAAFDPSGIRTYIPEERKILEAFASVAAAALEVATALDDSRRQAAIAEAMSELLDEERTLLSRIVESLPHGVSWTDSSGAIEGCNQALADLLDCQLSQIKGQRWADLCPDADMANRCTSWAEEVVSSCEPVINAEMPLTVGDERRVALVSVVPLSCGGSDERVLSIWADVTDQRSMEQRLAETSRLESIGQLAAGVAHEINTPMQYIGDNSAFLDKAFGLVTPLIDQLAELASVHGADQRAIDDLMSKAKLDLLRTRIPRANAQVAEGVTAVSRIVRSLKTFAHPGGDDLGPVDMAQVLDSTVTVARNEWKYAAHLDLDVAPDLPPVRAVPGMVNQVFLNLLVNAAHAVDERRAAEQTGQLGQITITCRALGDWVETQVSDDGGGIPDAVREKIYDQFFTTKGIGKGSGQGLAICRNIITRHEGTIDFTTSPQGTTFVVRLLLWHGSDGPSPID